MTIRFFILFTLLAAVPAHAEVVDFKRVDDGGSGHFSAIAATHKSLPDYVVYRPHDIEAAVAETGKLPVLVFGNGGCADTSITHERVLSDIASHGYIIVAIGALQHEHGREPESTPSSMLVDAMDWVAAQSEADGELANRVDVDRMGVMGQSCGGAQTIYASADARVQTSVMFNSGMGDMTMAGASTESLQELHAPILYVIGGPSDVAHPNALIDYERISHVPVVFADLKGSGHMGTFGEPFGGSYSDVTLAWLDWQLKGQDQHAALFTEQTLGKQFEGWSVKAKNF